MGKPLLCFFFSLNKLNKVFLKNLMSEDSGSQTLGLLYNSAWLGPKQKETLQLAGQWEKDKGGSLPWRALEFQGDPVYLPAKMECLCRLPNPYHAEKTPGDTPADCPAPQKNHAALVEMRVSTDTFVRTTCSIGQ